LIRMAMKSDLDVIDSVALRAIQAMSTSNIPQWTEKYPRKEHFSKDIDKGNLFVFDDGEVCGAIVISVQDDPPYEELDTWTHNSSIVLHRIIVDPLHSRKGIARKMFEFAIMRAKEMGFESIKIDTHKENYKMLSLLDSFGFKEVGFLTSINRVAFELLL